MSGSAGPADFGGAAARHPPDVRTLASDADVSGSQSPTTLRTRRADRLKRVEDAADSADRDVFDEQERGVRQPLGPEVDYDDGVGQWLGQAEL